MKPVLVELSKLKPDPKNARKHDRRNIEAIKQSLMLNEQYRPFVVQKKTNRICIGNGMYEAMQELGIDKGWVEYRDLTEKEFTKLAIADNRTSELAEWDWGQLKESFEDLGLDESIPGWSKDEMEAIAASQEDISSFFEDSGEEEESEEVPETEMESCPYCGHSLP